MKKLSVMLCLIALLAFTLNGCGGSGTTDTSYYGGGDGGGTTTTAPSVTSCTTNLTPGQTCTVNGANFGSSRDSGQSTISFVPQVTGGTTLTATTYLSWSDTAIQCVTPSVVTGIQYVVVVNRYTSSGTLYSSTTYTAGVNGNNRHSSYSCTSRNKPGSEPGNSGSFSDPHRHKLPRFPTATSLLTDQSYHPPSQPQPQCSQFLQAQPQAQQ